MILQRADLDAARDAEQALKTIADGKPVSAEVLTRLKGLPTLLRISGVAATLALFAAKSSSDDLGRAYREVRSALVTQLRQTLAWPQPRPDIYGELAKLSAVDLARVQVRLAVFADWLRRLAEAEENEQKARRERDEQERARLAQSRNEKPPLPTPQGSVDG